MERLRIAAAAALAVSTLMLCRAVAYEERGESAGDDTEVVDPSAVQPVLPIHDQNGIRYVSGGIGDEEQRALAELAPRFDLKLVFARSDMAYHADVTVRIADEKGREVLLARDVGPYVLVDLPPGHYRVTAENQGEGAGSAKVQTASLSGHGQTKLSFYW